MNAVVAGLPKSWRHRAEHDDELIGAIEIVDALPRLVDHHQRVHPDVALRMPFRFLLAADERLQLRKQLIDDAKLAAPARSRSTAVRAQQQLLDFAPDALRRQIVEPDRCGTASSSCSSSVSSKRAANCTARSTRRLSSPNVAGSTALQDVLFEIGAAVERVEIFVGQRIPGDRVDREVAAARRLLDRHRWDRLRRRIPCGRGPLFDSRRGRPMSIGPIL